jgi:hypothetical protein
LKARNSLSRFDLVVFTVIAGLLAVIAATVALADFRKPGAAWPTSRLLPAWSRTRRACCESVAQNIWIADPGDRPAPSR